MKALKFLAIAAIAIMMASCGGSKNEENNAQLDVDAISAQEQITDDIQEASEVVENSATEKYEENDENEVETSSSNSQDWDALLNSYEQYVDKYISYMKKAAKGDMSALAEYPALMEKAQEFSDKMSGAQGEMSASQWARYMKITQKMTKAASSM